MQFVNPEAEAWWNREAVQSLWVLAFARRWANLMEEMMDPLRSVAEVAQEAFLEADKGYDPDDDDESGEYYEGGISGRMFGVAIAALERAWIHGPALREWHNANS